MNYPIIKIHNLYKSYPSEEESNDILKNIELEIEKGDFVAIIGQSGSGKSTLMNILGCLDKPTSGTYEVYGTEISQLKTDDLAKLRCNHFGFIFQKYQLISGLTALENVEMPAIYSGMSLEKRRKRATTLLKQLGLAERMNHTPGKLSGGQQQRVSIARALMNGGEVIFADEPTGALDSKSGAEVIEILQNLNKQGHTIIMVTHDPKLAQKAKRIIEIKDGEIINDERINQPILSHLPHSISKNKFFSVSTIYGNIRENYKMAVLSITHNKLRSFLTMLGIIIGISSVISMVAIGNGTTTKLLNKLGEETARSIYIWKGGEYKVRNIMPPAKSFYEDDFKYLQSLPYLKNIMPSTFMKVVLRYGNESINANIEGCDYNCIEAKDLKTITGTGFSKEQIKNLSLVAILDEESAKTLFHNDMALGKIITVSNIPVKIIGVVKKKTIGDQRSSGRIYLPYTTTFNRFLGSTEYPGFSMIVKKGYSIASAKDNINAYFFQKHGKNKDYEIITLDEQLKDFYAATSGMKLFILLIAAISLIVGGIGVMNIMLVSVTERTPEIGIRMAVGAKEQDIKQQFLIESIILCLFGGILGIILAFLIGHLINILVVNNPNSIIGFSYSINSVIVAVFFSTLIGIIFGYTPAKNASKLDPVVALSRK